MSVVILTVDEVMRKLSNDGQYPFVVNDKTVDIVRFALNTGFTDVVLDEQTALRVMYQRPGETEVRAQTLTYYDTDGLHNYYDWQLLSADLAEKGALTVALCILRTDSEVEEWHTTPCQVRVLGTIHTDDSDEADETITPTVAQRVAVLETMIQRVASGAPIVVSSTSAMTDTDQIYVLSTDGNWYYHNGTTWVSGGEYGAVATDTTLTQSGIPADAKTVGNAINAVTSDVEEVQDALEHLDVETDPTLSIDGKPADAKAVGDAVKPVQTDVSEHTTELALLITKTEKPQPEPTEIVQCADLSKARLESNKRYWNVKIEIPWIGRYDMNPSNLNLRFWYMHPYDSSGNRLQLYRGESSIGYLQINNGGYFEKVDSRTIKTYTASGTLDWTWHTDADISYLGFDDGSVYNAYIGDFEDPAQLVGVTYGGASETYIPYGESEVPDVPTEYEYEYSEELTSAIHNALIETYTDDEPTQDSVNFVKSGGVISYLLKETYNLIDPLWFDWSDASADYITLKTGLYIPVEAGRFLMSNAEKVRYTFYDSEKVSIDTVGSAVAYAPVAIPSNSAYMTCMLNNQSSGYIPSDHKIVIYYSDNTASPRDDIRDYIGHMNLQGMRGSNEIFDYYAPTALDKEVLQMAKYSAVRNINFCNNVLRIGTFNMYNPRRDYGWKTAKKMFADFAVDIVGFQEVSQGGRLLTEFLKGWQFTDGATWTNRAIASHFKVLSYDTYSISVTNNTFMRAIIQLPRYADVINPTLSVYDYHGIWDGGTPEKRAQEVSEILAVITQDTSDFIVVVGDTNAQSPSEWDTWRNAGFTPVHDGNGVITTIDEYCIDNVFYSSGITCKNYHVVPAEDYLVTISGEDLPISDHDFVFADLQFDFDSLIRS